MKDLLRELKYQAQHALQFRNVMQERDSQFCRREFRAASRQLLAPSRCGRGSYSTRLSLDFRVPRLVDTQICETFRRKVFRTTILGIFRKFFKNIFWLVFGHFWGSKTSPPTPVRASGNETKISLFRPRETLTGTRKFLIPRIYGLWQTLMFIGFYEY